MQAGRSVPRILAAIFSVTSLVVAAACATTTDTGDAPVHTPATTAATAESTGAGDAEGWDAETSSRAASPADSPLLTSGSAPGGNDPGGNDAGGEVPFLRIERATYDIGLADTETAVFTSGDGSIHCSFTAEHGQYNFPERTFAIDETVGNCLHGREGSGGDVENISVNTNTAVQDSLAQPQSDAAPTMPAAPATLDAGEFVHLGKMGCFAPDAAAITCTRYTTGDAFSISGAGFQQLSAEEVQQQLTDDAGYTQVLSRVIDLPLNGTEGIRCFYDSTDDSRYSCLSQSAPSIWEPTEGPGSANLLTWRVEDGRAEFERAFAANPGFDIYESRQPLVPGKYRLDEGMVADYDGSQVTFTTSQGESFWVNGPEYGTGS